MVEGNIFLHVSIWFQWIVEERGINGCGFVEVHVEAFAWWSLYALHD